MQLTPLGLDNKKYNNQKQVSFGFNPYKSLTVGIARTFGKIADNKCFQKVVEKSPRSDTLVGHISVLTSWIVMACNVKDVHSSKKIEEERKSFAILDCLLVTAATTPLGYIIDHVINKWSKCFQNAAGEVYSHADNIKGELRELAIELMKEEKRADLDADISKDGKYESILSNNFEEEILKTDIEAKTPPKGWFKKKFSSSVEEKPKTLTELLKEEKIVGVIGETNTLKESWLGELLGKISNNDSNKELKNILEHIKNLKVEQIVKKVIEKDKLLESSKQELPKFAKEVVKYGFKQARSLAVFTLVIRFLVPISMIPVLGKVQDKIIDRQNRIVKDQKEHRQGYKYSEYVMPNQFNSVVNRASQSFSGKNIQLNG